MCRISYTRKRYIVRHGINIPPSSPPSVGGGIHLFDIVALKVTMGEESFLFHSTFPTTNPRRVVMSKPFEEIRTPRATDIQHHPNVHFNHLHALIIEDRPEVFEMYQRHIAVYPTGLQMISADSTERALSVVTREMDKIAVVVIAACLGGAEKPNTLRLIERLRRTMHYHVPFIAGADNETHNRILCKAGCDYAPKVSYEPMLEQVPKLILAAIGFRTY